MTLPRPTVSGASPRKTQMTGMDLNAWGLESSGPSLHLSGICWDDKVTCYTLTLDQDTYVLQPFTVPEILIAWWLGPERETFTGPGGRSWS